MKLIVLGFALLSAAAPAWVGAQTAPDPPDPSGTPPEARLEEIVVTAQKREERVVDVPISVSVLGGEEIDESSLQSVTEAFNTVAGVAASVGYQGGTTLVTVRGVGANAPVLAGSSPIAYYLDSAPFGFVTSAVAPDAAAYDLQRIEVLRGPQGTLYGANAQNGVVRVLTHDASPSDFELKARVTGGSTRGGSENFRGDAAVNVPIVPGRLGARAVVGYTELSGWVDAPVGSDVNDAQLRTYRLKLNAQLSDALSMGLSAWSSQNDYGAPSASDDEGRTSATLSQPIAADFEVYGLDIAGETSRFTVSSRTSYLEYANASTWDLSAAGLPNIPFFTNFDSTVFAEELMLGSNSRSAWRWTAGIAYRDARDGLLQTSVILPAPNDYSFRSESFAAFAEAGKRFSEDRFEWTLGLRYFHDDVLNRENVQVQPGVPLYHATHSFESTTPRVVLTWFPGENLTLYGSYAQGFRSGFPQNAAVVRAVPGFPPLEPDKLDNFEIGAKGRLSEALSFDAALYYIRWEDVQQSLSVLVNSLPFVANVNGKSASGLGADVGAMFRPAEGWELGLVVSWNDLTLDDAVEIPAGQLFAAGDRLNYSPQWTGSASAEYRFRLGSGGFDGAVAVSATYSSAQDFRGVNTGTTVLHGDALLIARARLSVNAPGGWTVSLFGDNLTDESGATPTVNLVPEWHLRVRPRTAGVQVDYHF